MVQQTEVEETEHQNIKMSNKCVGARVRFPYIPFTDVGVEGGPEELCMLTPAKEYEPLARASFGFVQDTGKKTAHLVSNIFYTWFHTESM